MEVESRGVQLSGEVVPIQIGVVAKLGEPQSLKAACRHLIKQALQCVMCRKDPLVRVNWSMTETIIKIIILNYTIHSKHKIYYYMYFNFSFLFQQYDMKYTF